MPENFERRGPGQEVPQEGPEDAGEAVVKAGAQETEESATESGPEKEITKEQIEARYQERMLKLEALKKAAVAQFGWDFSSLISGVCRAKEGLGGEPLFQDPKVIALVEGIERKEQEIYDERKKSLDILEERNRRGLGANLDEV